MSNETRFRGQLFQYIQRDIALSWRKNIGPLEKIGKTNSKKGFFASRFAKPPILTGGTKKDTSAKIILKQNRLTIRHFTPNNQGWRQLPLLGKGTSKSYGERNWLLEGAKLTAKDILKLSFKNN